MIRALDHVQLAMPAGGEAAARAFYEGVLGIPEVRKPPALAARGGCWFERGALKVHLGVDLAFVPARKAHPGFAVDDLEALLAVIEAGGCVATRETAPDGRAQAYVEDPFGNRIELLAG
jgi:catechol 2,3-dioxygenase-like lactoylglutathione lyase family enzyme